MFRQRIVQQAFAEYLAHVTPDTFDFEARLLRRTLDRLTATPAVIDAPAVAQPVQVIAATVLAAPVPRLVDPHLAAFNQTRDARRALAQVVTDDAGLCFAFAPDGEWAITTDEPRIAVRAVNLDDALGAFRSQWSAAQPALYQRLAVAEMEVLAA
jgi:hypothetical protein